jgi:hypothetical protein
LLYILSDGIVRDTHLCLLDGNATTNFLGLRCYVMDAEKLWEGLENFVFDWLINADR